MLTADFTVGDAPTTTPHDDNRDRRNASVVDVPDDGVAVQAEPAVTVLRPNASIQFLDLAISDAAARRVTRRYLEEQAESATAEAVRALYAVELDDTGTLRHPISGDVLAPDTCYGVSGHEALSAFEGTWIPLPYMRLDVAADDSVAPTSGPSNWARVWISKDEHLSGWRLVVAFDTTIAASDEPAADALMPTQRDLADRTIFGFSDDVAHIEWFVTENWVDSWLRVSAKRSPALPAVAEHTHTALYLTVLNVLAAQGILPDVQFAASEASAQVAIDLVVELGFQAARATFVGNVEPASPPVASNGEKRFARAQADRQRGLRGEASAAADPLKKFWCEPLILRDIGKPTEHYSGTFPAAFTFAATNFGHEQHARASGRLGAFAWPSLGRIGHEAMALRARDAGAGRDTLGRSSLLDGAWNPQAAEVPWRFARAHARDKVARRLATGRLAATLEQLGAPTENGGAVASTSAIAWPTYPTSDLVAFFVAELTLQAMSALSTVKSRCGAKQPTLGGIVIALPGAIAAEHAQQILSTAKRGIDALWNAMGWSLTSEDAAKRANGWPKRPKVSLGADATTAATAAYLDHEIARHFRAQPRDYIALLGQERDQSDRAGVGRSLRVATVDVGARTTSVVIDTWRVDDANRLVAQRMLADGYQWGGDGVAQALAQAFLWPAIQQKLVALSISEPDAALQRILGRSGPATVGDDRAASESDADFNARFAEHIEQPFAAVLFELNRRLKRPSEEAPAERALHRLLGTLTEAQQHVLDELDRRAAREGAGDLGAGALAINVLHRDVVNVIHAAMRPWFAPVADIIRTLECDLVLLAGRTMTLPAVRDLFLEAAAARPDRIVNLASDGAPGFDSTRAVARGQALLGRAGTPASVVPWGKIDASRQQPSNVALGVPAAPASLPDDRALFLLTPNVRTRLHEEKHRPTATLTFMGPDDASVTISARRLALERWPASPYVKIQLLPELLSAAREYPIRVTIELHVAKGRSLTGNQLPGIRVTKVRDGVGTQLATDGVAVFLDASGPNAMTRKPTAEKSTN